MPPAKARKCSLCGVKATLKNTNTRVSSGTVYWNAYCKSCKAGKTRRWRKQSVVSYLYAGCKSRAKRQGAAFNIEKSDIVIPERCPVLGIPLFVAPGGRSDNSPTVDRIDPHRGYVRGNVAVISWRANRLKNDATPLEISLIAAFVAAHS